MATDPAFLFYPGDYLRDTQTLSEKSQVAYDRIMCAHMKIICESYVESYEDHMQIIGITKEQLNFFTKRLSEDEKKEVLYTLTKNKIGFQIEWVAESIYKRRSYTESRSKNKKGKLKNISKSYENHMENENEIENEDEIIKGVQGEKELSPLEIGNTIEFIDRIKQIKLSHDDVKNFWQAFLLNGQEPAYYTRGKKIQHFRNWVKTQKNGHTSNSGSNGTHLSARDRQAAAGEKLLNKLRDLTGRSTANT